PVPAKMMDWAELLFRPKTARPPILMPKVGPKSVRGTYVGPWGLVVRKSVVFQTPPLAPAMYTVLPEGSDGSTAMPPMRPPPVATAAGPTDVQSLCDSGLIGSVVKMRNVVIAWSAAGSPRPLVDTGFNKVIDQLLSVPEVPPT